jgi:hypothetical protein
MAMKRADHDALGSDEFVDALEQAVLRGKQVAVELRDGTAFVDRITDVTASDGKDVAVFEARGRIEVAKIRTLSHLG